jgi:hypothetical protein
MKKYFIKTTLIAGALCVVATSPIFAQEPQLISAPITEVIPISTVNNHWSKIYVEQLISKFEVQTVFDNKDLNSTITMEDFINIVKLAIDPEYKGEPESLSREAIVSELTKIWAGKTGKNLDDIAVIKMIIYADRDKIDGKYDHSLSVAFMYNIAKGRGDRIFDPKTNVTYGELAALISNTLNAIEKELKPEIPSIVKGNLETRGNCIIANDKVSFDFELFSNYERKAQLMFSSGQQFEIVITNEMGEEVYRFSEGKFFTEALIFKDLEPGESIKWHDEWDMKNKEGNKVASGKYEATITIMDMTGEDSEKLTEEELTKVIEFNI